GHNPKEIECSHRAWVDPENHEGKQDVLEIKFSGEGLIHVPVSRSLRLLEQRMLSTPDETLSWRMAVTAAQKVDISPDVNGWPSFPDMDSFRTKRRELFARILGSERQHIIQSTDLFPL